VMRNLVRRALFAGLFGAIAGMHLGLVGMLETFQAREMITDVIALGSTLPILVAILVGWRAGGPMRHPPIEPRAITSLWLGALSGLTMGVLLALFAIFITTADISWILQNANQRTADVLQYEQGPALGSAIQIGVSILAGFAGASLHVLPRPVATALAVGGLVAFGASLMEPFVGPVLSNLGLSFVEEFLYEGGGMTLMGFILVFALAAAITYLWATRGSEVGASIDRMPLDRRQTVKIVLYLALIALFLVMPFILGKRLSEVAGTVGLYVLLGLGLNIVVGFAGLLDLGYVAFYAVGAYTIAILTSPASPAFSPELPFWGALPFVILAAGLIGLAVGAPVLRLRGDYLAIVTLGFGEIARIIFLSAWTAPVFGGSQGILSIPPPLPFSRDPQVIYYPILAFCVIAAFAATRLATSRVGRAWNAMREDEAVAEATGVNTTAFKLLAFGLGAAFGCLSGAFFAAKIGSVFPHSFDILVSINALALIILGGMGNIIGVVVGAAVLVGLPELLREFTEYRLLIYGAVLIAMMLLRPEGLLPSRARRAELHEVADDDEEQYAREAGEETGRPVVTV
jgi:branched-chain amino acid transport system permease protein